VRSQDKQLSLLCTLLQEVEFFSKHGELDITLGVPFLPHHLSRFASLKQQCPAATVRIVLDSEASLGLLNSALNKNDSFKSLLCPISVFLKVDCGYHRAGVDPEANPEGALALAKAISGGPNTSLFGLYAHSGNAYNTGTALSGAATVAQTESSRIAAFAAILRDEGVTFEVVSVGSTPSCMAAESMPAGVTEMHPGNFLFFDLQQVDSGACASSDVSVAVLSRVIGVYPLRNEILIDAGGTAVHKDPGGVHGWGAVEGHPDLCLLRMSQECTVVGLAPEAPHGAKPLQERFQVGGLLRVTPNHSCMTACQHERYHVLREHSDDTVAVVWKPCKYW